MPTFEFETLLDCPVPVIFTFLAQPANVARVSDPNLGLTLVDAPEVVQKGSSIEFEIVSFGQLHRIIYEIVTVDAPRLIVERQTKGPMKSWRQEHHFEPAGKSSRLVDIVEYELPGGMLGMLLSEDKIVDQLEDGFFHRERALKRLISAGELS